MPCICLLAATTDCDPRRRRSRRNHGKCSRTRPPPLSPSRNPHMSLNTSYQVRVTVVRPGKLRGAGRSEEPKSLRTRPRPRKHTRDDVACVASPIAHPFRRPLSFLCPRTCSPSVNLSASRLPLSLSASASARTPHTSITIHTPHAAYHMRRHYTPRPHAR